MASTGGGPERSIREDSSARSSKIWVGNLAPEVTDASLHDHFVRYGGVRYAGVSRFDDGSSRRFGYVTFANPAVLATVLTSDIVIAGQRVVVREARRNRATPHGPVPEVPFPANPSGPPPPPSLTPLPSPPPAPAIIPALQTLFQQLSTGEGVHVAGSVPAVGHDVPLHDPAGSGVDGDEGVREESVPVGGPVTDPAGVSDGMTSEPASEELDELKVYVGNLPRSASNARLRLHFEGLQLGCRVTRAIIKTTRETNAPKGYGFVTFENAEAVSRALAMPHFLDGVRLEVRSAVKSTVPTVPSRRPPEPGSATPVSHASSASPTAVDRSPRSSRPQPPPHYQQEQVSADSYPYPTHPSHHVAAYPSVPQSYRYPAPVHRERRERQKGGRGGRHTSGRMLAFEEQWQQSAPPSLLYTYAPAPVPVYAPPAPGTVYFSTHPTVSSVHAPLHYSSTASAAPMYAHTAPSGYYLPSPPTDTSYGARSHFQPHPTPGTILHPPGQWQWAVPDTSAVPIHMTTAHPGYYGTVPVVTQPPPIALPLFIPTLPAVSTLHSPASWSSNNASTTTAASSASASPHPPGPSEPPPTQAQQLPNAIGSGRVTPLHQPHPPEHMPPAPTRASTPDVTDAGDSASVGEASVAL